MKGGMLLRTTGTLFTRHGGAAALGHQRGMVGKAANRAAVHGTKLPVPDTVPKNKVEIEIAGAIEDKERRRREIEKSVDSNLKNWQVLYVEEIVSAPTKIYS